MAIDPLDPTSLSIMFNYLDKHKAKYAKYKRSKEQDVLKDKERPFTKLKNHPGYPYRTPDNGMHITGYTIPKLAKSMGMPYITLKGYVNNNIIPKPELPVVYTDSAGMVKPTKIYTLEEGHIISSFIYEYFYNRKITMNDYNEYKEKRNDRNI